MRVCYLPSRRTQGGAIASSSIVLVDYVPESAVKNERGAAEDLVPPSAPQLSCGIGTSLRVASPRRRYIGCSNNRHDNVATKSVTIPNTTKRKEGIVTTNRS